MRELHQSFIQGNIHNVKRNEVENVKLSKQELKSFSGNDEEWQSFWDNIESAVNRNTEISRIQKFTSFILCNRRNWICNYRVASLTEGNYETTFDILRDRFGKPQLLISNHMEALLKLQIVSSVHEMKELRDLSWRGGGLHIWKGWGYSSSRLGV